MTRGALAASARAGLKPRHYNGEKQAPRCAWDDTGALAAVALAGLKTRHYNGEKQVPRCAWDDTGALAAVALAGLKTAATGAKSSPPPFAVAIQFCVGVAGERRVTKYY